MKKMLFIRPCATVEDLAKVKYSQNYYIMPLGILSIVAYCRSKLSDVEFKILDFGTTKHKQTTTAEMYVDIRKVIREYEPDVVGISILASSTANHANPIAKIVKDYNPDICTLFGGVSSSVMTLEEMEETIPNVDAVCYSEGEIPTLELLAATAFFAELESNDAFITHSKAKTRTFVPTAKCLRDLDDIPVLPLDMLDTDSYENSVLELDGRKSIVMHTARGCPFACNFCAAPSLFGRNMRFYSAERVISDFKAYSEKYGYDQIVILDEQLLINRDRVSKILGAIAEMDVVMSVPNGINIALIDEEIAGLFSKVHIDRHVFAIESGSQRVLKELMNKPVNLEKASKALKLIYSDKLETHSNFIIGMPGETEEDRRQTIDYIKSNYIDWSVFFLALPLRGSKLYRDCLRDNHIVLDKNGLERIKTEDIDPDEMDEKGYLYNLECNFVFNFAMRMGDYRKAKTRFEFVRTKYPYHAFAHHYYAKCCEVLGEQEECDRAMKIYFDEVKGSERWTEYATHFGLPTKA